MWFYMKLAWRNMFRNKRRTIIASIAIGIGLASLIFSAALMEGMVNNMIHSATSSFLGEAQIHHRDFRETQAVEKIINDAAEVKEELKKDNLVEKFTPRTLSMGMISSPANVDSVILVGVQPETEVYLSKIDNALKEGDFFKGNNKRDIVIGSNLAESLEVGLGDRIVVTVSQAGSGDLSQEMFRISGIYHFDIKELDKGMAFVRLEVAQKMLSIDKGIHQIAIKFKDSQTPLKSDLSFWANYSKGGNEAVPWTKILPQMKAVISMIDVSLIFTAIILGAIVIFGIINTLFMSLYERMFEFGVMRAVGTRSGGLAKLIILEAGALGIISVILGVALGVIITSILSYTGIDYRGIEFAGTTFHDLIYPESSTWHFVVFPLGVIIFTMLVGIYPAWVAGRLKIAEALRKSM